MESTCSLGFLTIVKLGPPACPSQMLLPLRQGAAGLLVRIWLATQKFFNPWLVPVLKIIGLVR